MKKQFNVVNMTPSDALQQRNKTSLVVMKKMELDAEGEVARREAITCATREWLIPPLVRRFLAECYAAGDFCDDAGVLEMEAPNPSDRTRGGAGNVIAMNSPKAVQFRRRREFEPWGVLIPLKKTTREDFSQAAARIVREATEII